MNEITNDTATLQKALLMIKKLKQMVHEQRQPLAEPVAIVGMGCRFPKVSTVNGFWELLCTGQSVITPLPESRWALLEGTDEAMNRVSGLDYWGGYLEQISDFDPYFFGITPREALRMDPQQRLLLEVSYEALENAGLTLEALSGSNTGVFSSLYASQFSHLQHLEDDMDALFLPTGSAISIAANRLSYVFDLRGPSMVLDTSCSSSLIAVQLACLNIQAGLCDQALVSAAHINLLPSTHAVLRKANMLSPTGQCHTFDASADGYVQGEGVCAIFLKPLSKALQDNDRVYAVITGSAVNQDGKTNGLTAPNGLQQEALLQSAYRAAKTDIKSVSYIECHGTGTLLGDPIEVQALGNVVGKDRDANQSCWISTLKTNIGHLEPAAGLAGMMKTALILFHGQIPPHRNLNHLNPHIAFDQYALSIPKRIEPLPHYGQNSVAGVSGFGFGGTNAHIVLQSVQQETLAYAASEGLELFTLSAKDDAALMAYVGLWCDFLSQNPALPLAPICYHLHCRRSHFSQRLAVIAKSTMDLLRQLQALLADPDQVSSTLFIHRGNKKNNNPTVIADTSSLTLPALALHYIQQARIDWKAHEKHRRYTFLDLPSYPWQHKSYWPVLGKTQHQSNRSPYPLQGRRLSSPLNVQQFEFCIDTAKIPEIKDTFHVVHAGFYLDMLSFALQTLQPNTMMIADDVAFHSPLIIVPGKSATVQLILESHSPQQTFKIYSNAGKQVDSWVLHASGTLLSKVSNSLRIDQQVRQINAAAESHTAFYQRIIEMGMPAGDTVRWIDQFWRIGDALWCELRVPKACESGEQFAMGIHPCIIDACIQTVFLLLPKTVNKPFVAATMGQVMMRQQLGEVKYIYTRLTYYQAEDKTLIGEWALLNSHFDIVAQCEAMGMTQLGDTTGIASLLPTQSTFCLEESASYAERKQRIEEFLISESARIFSMPKQDISVDQDLRSLGMDSLMAMALVQTIEMNLRTTYSLPKLQQDGSIQQITVSILGENTETEKPIFLADNRWISYRVVQENPRMRLFCFPFGGGSASLFRDWQQEFPSTIEVCPIQLPGRENRMDEQPIDDINTMVAQLALHLQPLLNIPFAFFGHSFGALIGFELARYLRHHQLPQPIHLFPSAFPDPRTPSKSLHILLDDLEKININLFDLNQPTLAQLDDNKLIDLAEIFKNNGIVDYSDEHMNKKIVSVLLPIFIADMKLVKNYFCRDESALSCPLTVFVGEQDSWVAPEDHRGWSNHSSERVEFQTFERGHLFIREQAIRSQVIKRIIQDIGTDIPHLRLFC